MKLERLRMDWGMRRPGRPAQRGPNFVRGRFPQIAHTGGMPRSEAASIGVRQNESQLPLFERPALSDESELQIRAPGFRGRVFR